MSRVLCCFIRGILVIETWDDQGTLMCSVHNLGAWSNLVRRDWVQEVIDVLLERRREEAVIKLLKKPNLGPEIETSYKLMANIPFLGKVFEQVMAIQSKRHLIQIQKQELAWFTWDLFQKQNRRHAILLVFLNLSGAFSIINHGVVLDRLSEVGYMKTLCKSLLSFKRG